MSVKADAGADERGTGMKTEIIFEDKDILVAYKPIGLAVQTARVGQQDMVSELKNYLWQKRMVTGAALGRPAPYLGVIHRLDQPVEGLLVFAKNAAAASALTEQLRGQGEAGTLHKHYYGVICGKPEETEGELVDYIYKSKENKAVIVEGEVSGQNAEQNMGPNLRQNSGLNMGPNPQQSSGLNSGPNPQQNQGPNLRPNGGPSVKKAVLRYRILQMTDKPEMLALADIHILTGRFHQIRAQMAHKGTPLLGDLKYGGEAAKSMAKALQIQNVALCAYSMEFAHPVTGEKLSFHIKPRGRAFSFFQ